MTLASSPIAPTGRTCCSTTWQATPRRTSISRVSQGGREGGVGEGEVGREGGISEGGVSRESQGGRETGIGEGEIG